MSRLRFSGGEIVRLRIAREGVLAGSCGIVWGIYDGSPPIYEATFVNQQGEPEDATFEQDDVEQLSDVDVAPFPKRLEEIRRVLTSAQGDTQRGF
jgi:hypothetical protein